MASTQQCEHRFTWRYEFKAEIIGLTFRDRDATVAQAFAWHEVNVCPNTHTRENASNPLFWCSLSLTVKDGGNRLSHRLQHPLPGDLVVLEEVCGLMRDGEALLV